MTTSLMRAVAVVWTSAIIFIAAPMALQRGSDPREVTVCQLSTRPDSWNHARIRVTGLVTHDFEHFTLSDPACSASESVAPIWLTYGGRAPAETSYCCPGEGGQSRRSKPLVIDGIALPLVEDTSFLGFRKLLRTRNRMTTRATVVGTFFAGKQSDAVTAPWRGYGHLGCCTLLVIERILAFEAR